MPNLIAYIKRFRRTEQTNNDKHRTHAESVWAVTLRIRQTDITLHSNHEPAGLLYRVYCTTELTLLIHHSRLTLLYPPVKTVIRYDWVMLGTLERSSDRLIPGRNDEKLIHTGETWQSEVTISGATVCVCLFVCVCVCLRT